MSVTYYEYLCASGCGSDWSIVRLDTSNDKPVEIYAKSRWMGSKSNFMFKLNGTYTKVDGPYGIVEIEKAVDLITNTPYSSTEYFDFFTFDKPIKTERHAGMNVRPSEGWNPVATDEFQLQLIRNTNMYNHESEDELPDNVTGFLNSLKYKLITEERYNSLKNSFEKDK